MLFTSLGRPTALPRVISPAPARVPPPSSSLRPPASPPCWPLFQGHSSGIGTPASPGLAPHTRPVSAEPPGGQWCERGEGTGYFTALQCRVEPCSPEQLPPERSCSPRPLRLVTAWAWAVSCPGMPRPPTQGNPVSKLRLPPRKVSRAVREKKSQTTLPSGPAWTWVLGILVLTVLAAALLVLRAQG